MIKQVYLALLLTILVSAATAQVKMPQPSTTQYIRQDVGIGTIEVTYSRPNLKGRKIIGNQDAYDSIWRTGANAATKLKFSEPVTIGGKLIDTGTYVLYTIPRKKGDWDVIINKGVTNWGTDGYKMSDDVVRFTAPYTKFKNIKFETFTINFNNIKDEGADLQIMWDNWMVSFPITVNIKDKLRAQIETALQGEKKPYFQAANFYYSMDKDNAKALANVNKAIEGNGKAFWMQLLKAKILKDMGQNAEAKASATKCVELATDAKNSAYVQQGNELIKSLN